MKWSVPPWTTLLPLGALATFFLGLLAQKMSRNSKKHELRNALYSDLVLKKYALYRIHGFTPSNDEPVVGDEYFDVVGDLREMNLDIFDHYYTQERAAFYRLPEAEDIRFFYKTIKEAQSKQTFTGNELRIDVMMCRFSVKWREGALR